MWCEIKFRTPDYKENGYDIRLLSVDGAHEWRCDSIKLIAIATKDNLCIRYSTFMKDKKLMYKKDIEIEEILKEGISHAIKYYEGKV